MGPKAVNSFLMTSMQVYRMTNRLTLSEPIGFFINRLAKINSLHGYGEANDRNDLDTHTDARNAGTDVLDGSKAGV